MTQKPQQRRGLGRGLGSLIPTAPPRPQENGTDENGATGADSAPDGNGVPRSADWIGAMGDPETPAAEAPAPVDGDLRPVEGAHLSLIHI